MNLAHDATRLVVNTANATTAVAGAVGGAAVNGIVGGIEGTASGIRNGLGGGSRSTPAALLTMGAIGAAGLVEWPVLLTVGGAALLVHQLDQRSRSHTPRATASPPRKAAAKRSGRSASRRPAKPTSAKSSTRATRRSR